jgi:hypothetical protein
MEMRNKATSPEIREAIQDVIDQKENQRKVWFK